LAPSHSSNRIVICRFGVLYEKVTPAFFITFCNAGKGLPQTTERHLGRRSRINAGDVCGVAANRSRHRYSGSRTKISGPFPTRTLGKEEPGRRPCSAGGHLLDISFADRAINTLTYTSIPDKDNVCAANATSALPGCPWPHSDQEEASHVFQTHILICCNLKYDYS
jgi:hypothetical protein